MVPKGGTPLETPAVKPPGRRDAPSQQCVGSLRSPCLNAIAKAPTGCSPCRSELCEPECTQEIDFSYGKPEAVRLKPKSSGRRCQIVSNRSCLTRVSFATRKSVTGLAHADRADIGSSNDLLRGFRLAPGRVAFRFVPAINGSNESSEKAAAACGRRLS